MPRPFRARRPGTAPDESLRLHEFATANPLSGRHGNRFHPAGRGGDRFECFSGTCRQHAEPGRRTTGLQAADDDTTAKPDSQSPCPGQGLRGDAALYPENPVRIRGAGRGGGLHRDAGETLFRTAGTNPARQRPARMERQHGAGRRHLFIGRLPGDAVPAGPAREPDHVHAGADVRNLLQRDQRATCADQRIRERFFADHFSHGGDGPVDRPGRRRVAGAFRAGAAA